MKLCYNTFKKAEVYYGKWFWWGAIGLSVSLKDQGAQRQQIKTKSFWTTYMKGKEKQILKIKPHSPEDHSYILYF